MFERSEETQKLVDLLFLVEEDRINGADPDTSILLDYKYLDNFVGKDVRESGCLDSARDIVFRERNVITESVVGQGVAVCGPAGAAKIVRANWRRVLNAAKKTHQVSDAVLAKHIDDMDERDLKDVKAINAKFNLVLTAKDVESEEKKKNSKALKKLAN